MKREKTKEAALKVVASLFPKGVQDEGVAISLEHMMKKPISLQQNDARLIKVSYE